MLIHSITAHNLLLPPQELSPSEFRPWRKGWVEGEEQNGQFCIRRLISTDPADYLNPAYAPGQILPPQSQHKQEI